MLGRSGRPLVTLACCCLGARAAVHALAVGCEHAGAREAPTEARSGKSEEGATAGIKVIHPERRDMKTRVVQPGTIQAFEVTPIYSRISGYVQKYRLQYRRPRQGGRRPDRDVDSGLCRTARREDPRTVKMAEVQIRVAQTLPFGRPRPRWDGQGEGRVGPGRRQKGRGQLHAVGVGVQAAGDAGHPARP